ncbi:protein Wnt-10a-like [Ptychodera flava]|uniref:protein Wnt-10a-like n=1 Tax=Ptychodera flava TaxID=63121 RepID=UPI003969FD2C
MFLLPLALLFCLPFQRGYGNQLFSTTVKPKYAELDANTVCGMVPGLTRKQHRICMQTPGLVASAIQGMMLAVHECQYQMRNRRWDCSDLEQKSKHPYESPIMAKGYRETAFAYAIASAGVAFQVTRSCAEGRHPQQCGCDLTSRTAPAQADWQWGGCSHNVAFGELFAGNFLDIRENGRSDIHSRMNLKNNDAGRVIVSQSVKKNCKCHGPSGSCQIKTCWMETAEFRDIGSEVKGRFDEAVKVSLDNGRGRTWFSTRGNRELERRDLVYFERSPDFCEPSSHLHTPGTRGRTCNKTSTNMDNCDSMCCGRGYNIYLDQRTEKCNCTFHWCCYVTCDECQVSEWVNVCK